MTGRRPTTCSVGWASADRPEKVKKKVKILIFLFLLFLYDKGRSNVGDVSSLKSKIAGSMKQNGKALKYPKYNKIF